MPSTSPSPSDAGPAQLRRYDSGRESLLGFVSTMWTHRELLYFLVWRDTKVRYRQTALGAAWAVLQPLAATVVFSIFFGRLAKMPSDGVPYPLFAFAALVPWQFFANGVSSAAMSLANNANLLTKVAFPRLILPVASLAVGVIDLLVALLSFMILLLLYGKAPPLASVLVIPFIGLAFLASVGMGLFTSAVNVKYRDVRYVLPLVMQLGMLVTPIAYPSSLVGAYWQPVYALNPMVSVVDGFRWALLATQGPSAISLVISALSASAMALAGLVYFRAVQADMADVV